DYLDNTVKDPEEVERYLHLDLLAAVPQYDQANVHFVTEAYQNLRTALIFGRKDEAGQIVLVTGTVPQEGKTTTLVNLGTLLANSGEKTVMVHFDLRPGHLPSRISPAARPRSPAAPPGPGSRGSRTSSSPTRPWTCSCSRRAWPTSTRCPPVPCPRTRPPSSPGPRWGSSWSACAATSRGCSSTRRRWP